jgi:octaheme c-type cytochrome (tetrathionate reductase family)
MPDRDNCGVCHFFGGGGDGVKHGDMDSSLGKPDKALDVHMDAKGLNFGCPTCHTSDSHVLSGSRYAPTAKTDGSVAPAGLGEPKANCESCHTAKPHKGPWLQTYYLDNHVEKIACQTCHIPAMARGGVPTKMVWDWSTAGKMKDGKPYVEKDAKGYETYASIKGSFKWEENVKPHYAWFDGMVRYTLLDEKIEPKGVIDINHVDGARGDGKSRIWPFKEMQGKQAYDSKTNQLVYLNLFGQNDTAFWQNFDWPKSIAAGMKAAGKEFSGEYAFVPTKMYWPLAHMVAPKDKALACGECHARDGRLASLTGFYMPGRDAFGWLDLLGYLAIGGAFVGVLLHGLLRLLTRKSATASN